MVTIPNVRLYNEQNNQYECNSYYDFIVDKQPLNFYA